MIKIDKFLSAIAELVTPQKIFIVGGAIRDLLLRQSNWMQDIDLLLEVPVKEVANKVSSKFNGRVIYFKNFGTAKVLLPPNTTEISEIDFAQARKEYYPQPASLPVVSFVEIDQDLKRRDITINSMAVSLSHFIDNYQDVQKLKSYLLDPFEGLTDIQNQAIRILHDKSFIDDPTRLFRIVRYKTRFKFQYEANTLALLRQAILNNLPGLLSEKRITQELKKILEEKNFSACLEEMISLNLLHPLYQDIISDLKKLSTSSESNLYLELLRLLASKYPLGKVEFFNAISLEKEIRNKLT